MAHHPDAGHSSPDDEYLPVAGSSYEHTDAHAGPIAKFLFWLFVAAVLTHFGLAGLYKFMYDRGVALETSERRYPMSVEQSYRLPPAPRLQQFPVNERYTFQLEEQQLLNSYGWENKAAGTVRIPISDAMRLTVERGLPSRATGDAAAAQVPGLMPSDASAGRVLERRRQ
jgi:hypothetical protein